MGGITGGIYYKEGAIKMKIGAITVGQSPRTDVTEDIMDIFNGKAEVLERGGLDGLTREQIEKFSPKEGDYVLVSRLNDGTSVTFGERHIIPRIQHAIEELEEQGAYFIMMFCTGKFPDTLKAKVPLIYPCEILDRTVPLLTAASSILVVTPSPLQIAQSEKKWSRIVRKVKVVSGSPYGEWKELEETARLVRDTKADLVILDCIGFSRDMKRLFAEETGKPVILPRTLLARLVSELTDV
ncbi:protein AroM [Lacrimispora sphenoides]|nr:protein AroM [Lacrimispora sphenoides]